MFGDHKLIILELSYLKPIIKPVIQRDWRRYDKEYLKNTLSNTTWGEGGFECVFTMSILFYFYDYAYVNSVMVLAAGEFDNK